MCVRNKGNQADTSRDWYFEDATVQAAVKLTKKLMDQYHVLADHVIRHYDVTGKICPNPYVYNTTRHTWADFRAAIAKAPESPKKFGWIEDDFGRWYRHDDGSCTRNGWENIGGKWYWFNEDGYACRSQWIQNKGKWYYLGGDSAIRSLTVTNHTVPTGNLDSKTGAEIMNLLREINQSIGQTIIMVTHSQEAARSSTRMITVQDGLII